jgi:hypothetical protein
MASTHPIPTARQGPAQRNHFPINKTADRGQEDFLGRARPFADGISGKKMGGKRWGLLFSALLTRALTGMPTDSGLRRFLIPHCAQD